MLFGKGNAYNRDPKKQCPEQMGQRDFPAKEDEPNDVEDDVEWIASLFCFHNSFAKGHECCQANFDAL